MLNKLVDKIVESTMSTYVPKMMEMAMARKEELKEITMMARNNPEQVEAWFHKKR